MADETVPLPATVRELALLLLGQIAELGSKIDALERNIRRRAPQDEQIARLMTIPGVGAICATAVQAFCPSPSALAWPRSGVAATPRLKTWAAWLGLTPKQHSTGGKTRLGKTSKMGQRDSRRLLIIGASAVVTPIARLGAAREGVPQGSWLARMMMAKKTHMVVVVALANKMARIVWALTVRDTT